MITTIFILFSVIVILTGGYISNKLCDKEYNKFIRYVVLAPALASMFTLWFMLKGDYVPYFPDVVKLGVEVLVYVLLAKNLRAFASHTNRRSNDRGTI